MAVILVVLLLVGFWKLQVVQTGHFADLAERNRVHLIPIIAPRGAILDREGRILADTYPSFSILLLRDDMKLVHRTLPQIEEGLGITQEDIEQQLEAAKNEAKFQPIVIKPLASVADIAFVESHRADLLDLELMMVQRRRYAHGNLLSSAIGYVGEVSPTDLEQSEGRYRPGDIVGKAGLEKEYNPDLEGTDGMRRLIVNSVGKLVRTLENVEAVPGKPIQLTIDLDLQELAEANLTGKRGALVALDPRTGEVLAMVSHPTPDPNDFAVRIPREEWQALNDDPAKPLLNRAIQAQLAPGSVFKIVMGTAMLETKAVPLDYTVYCPGYAEFYGRTFHCWQKNGHGLVGFHRAIVDSCDVYFYNVGKRLGIDRISLYASSLGLGRRAGIDLPSEETGLVPSEQWTERVFHRKWYPGETISVAVGQGALTVTPLQLAHTIAGIAMGGTFYQPHLLKTMADVHVDRFPLQEDTVEKITQAMFGVVNEGGTAADARLQNVELCGKTGSAQVIGYNTRNRLGKQKEFKDNAWFVGYAPRRNPEIVVAVLVEGGEHGASIAPIARDIVKAYYDKKNARLQHATTAEIPKAPSASLASVGSHQP